MKQLQRKSQTYPKDDLDTIKEVGFWPSFGFKGVLILITFLTDDNAVGNCELVPLVCARCCPAYVRFGVAILDTPPLLKLLLFVGFIEMAGANLFTFVLVADGVVFIEFIEIAGDPPIDFVFPKVPDFN